MEITDFQLLHGEIIFTATRHGPVSACKGFVTIFGADGQGVLQNETEVEVPEVRAHERLLFPIRITMEWCK
jgi:hypothetical protein